MEEFSLEELDADDGEDEHEEEVDDSDVGDVLHRVHHAVKHGLDRHIDTVEKKNQLQSTQLVN